ncbi:MAG: aac(3)-I [Sphingomonas bacterium]|uniref:AAC(3)-I family aminoglycoside N-acetyltransferase n=1 Tax=Sphingomonas bacterium TaxID=1895847 RepID=UPI00260A956C|nr:AAC(3)-I family aminoglycoside N-acetyltransferase [Sphingomonas bacterium]MDB5710286.1 aac(3)-I [Sphingomonas bacterium]
MKDYRLRQLGAGDVASMEKLTEMFGQAFEEPESYGVAPPGEAYLERLLARDHFIALAAFDGDDLVGGLVAYVLDKFEQQRSEIYIYDLAVAEAHRRRGISTALIVELQRIGTLRGAWVIFVQADHGDDPAIALYTGLGTREDVLHFDIAVPSA